MQTVLVTGADGFIGSHLTELMLEKGFKVRALTQYNSFNNWGWLEDIPKNENLEIITGDIRDPYFCKTISTEVDIIYHLAALIAIPYSYKAPNSYVQTNILGTLNMCQAALENRVKRFIQISTSEVYGTAQYVPIDEKHPKQPQSPYSASKIGSDAMAMSYFHSFNLPVTIARPFNTYGPRQSARAVIPTIITQIIAGYETIRVGDLNPTRDMNYVKDTCKGLFLIANHENTIGKEINICSNSEITIAEILVKIKKIMDSNIEHISENQRMRPIGSEVYRLFGDNRLIKELTGFNSDFSIDKGLQLTCDWFLMKGKNMLYKANIYNL